MAKKHEKLKLTLFSLFIICLHLDNNKISN